MASLFSGIGALDWGLVKVLINPGNICVGSDEVIR